MPLVRLRQRPLWRADNMPQAFRRFPSFLSLRLASVALHALARHERFFLPLFQHARQRLFLLLLLPLLLMGCTSRYYTNPFASPVDVNSPDAGTLHLSVGGMLHGNVDRLVITIAEVEVLQGGKWLLVSKRTKDFDLMAVRETTSPLLSTHLNPGKYAKIRFKLKSAKAYYVTSTCQGLPSADRGACASKEQVQSLSVPLTKIEVPYDFAIAANASTDVVLDFNASSVRLQQAKYVFSVSARGLAPAQYQLRFINPYCGDGYCQRVTCTGQGCPPLENEQTCPKDCKE